MALRTRCAASVALTYCITNTTEHFVDYHIVAIRSARSACVWLNPQPVVTITETGWNWIFSVVDGPRKQYRYSSLFVARFTAHFEEELGDPLIMWTQAMFLSPYREQIHVFYNRMFCYVLSINILASRKNLGSHSNLSMTCTVMHVLKDLRSRVNACLHV